MYMRRNRPDGVVIDAVGRLVNLKTLHAMQARNVALVEQQLKLPNGATFTKCKSANAFALSVEDELDGKS